MLWGGIKKNGKCFVTFQDCNEVEQEVWIGIAQKKSQLLKQF